MPIRDEREEKKTNMVTHTHTHMNDEWNSMGLKKKKYQTIRTEQINFTIVILCDDNAILMNWH